MVPVLHAPAHPPVGELKEKPERTVSYVPATTTSLMWENFSNGPAATGEIKGTDSAMPNPTYRPHWVVAKRR